MTTHISSTDESGPGRAAHHVRTGLTITRRAEPHHMPAGGWIREIATSENWRTTTIVQRHRDRALPISSP